MSDIWIFPPIKIGGEKHLFWLIRNLVANLTAYIFRVKHGINNRASVLETTRGLLHRHKTSPGLVCLLRLLARKQSRPFSYNPGAYTNRTCTIFAVRIFRNAAPSVWNSLPLYMYITDNLDSPAGFKSALKTYYYSLDFWPCDCTSVPAIRHLWLTL